MDKKRAYCCSLLSFPGDIAGTVDFERGDMIVGRDRPNRQFKSTFRLTKSYIRLRNVLRIKFLRIRALS